MRGLYGQILAKIQLQLDRRRVQTLTTRATRLSGKFWFHELSSFARTSCQPF